MTTAFRRIQVGLETTRGTAVAADKKLVGSLTMTPNVTWHRPIDERNSLAEFRRSIAVAQMTRLRYEADATYHQLADILSMAVKGAITPTTPGGGTNSRDWTFTPTLTAKQVQDAYTFEYGDDIQTWESAFTIIENLELSIALNEVVTLRADMFAKFAAKTTFTASISDPTVTEVVANNAKIYIDGTYANLGTTQQASLLAGATIRLPNGVTPVKYADGDLEFSSVSEQRRHLEIEMDLISSTAAITEYDAYVAGTDRAIRIELVGPVIEGSLNYTLTIDAFGKYVTEPDVWGERDGEDIMRLVLHSHEDASGNEFSFVVRNNVASI